MDFSSSVRKFILSEKFTSPSLASYMQALSEDLENLSPKRISDSRRLEIAKENLANIKRYIRRLEEKVSFLEEELKGK